MPMISRGSSPTPPITMQEQVGISDYAWVMQCMRRAAFLLLEGMKESFFSLSIQIHRNIHKAGLLLRGMAYLQTLSSVMAEDVNLKSLTCINCSDVHIPHATFIFMK